MKRSRLTRLTAICVLLLSCIFLFFYIYFLPRAVAEHFADFPDKTALQTPCTVLLLLTALPVAAAIGAFLCVLKNIAMDRSFSKSSDTMMRLIGLCALTDCAIMLAAALLLLIGGAADAGMLLLGSGVLVAGLCVAAAAFLLAALIGKAVSLQEEVDLTV